MKKLFFCLYLMAMVMTVCAQHSTRQGLQIGDTVPNVFFGETMQGNLPVKCLASIKAKLTLLDFWETGCIGCILGMPVMDSLQQTFGNNIQTIIICRSERNDVERVFKAIKRPFPKTPIVIQDSVLNKYFPHVTVPHHVWIDQHRVVRFITYDYNATVGNVRKFLNGEPLHMSLRKQVADYDNQALLFNEGNGRWNREIKYHTLFATYLDGVEHTDYQTTFDSVTNSQALRIINYPYRFLFAIAYNESFGDGIYFQHSRWLMETKDTTNFYDNMEVDSLIDKWNKASIASYEAVLPGNNEKELFKTMQRDLNVYSPYFARIEKRKVKCLILVNKGIQPSKYKGKDSVFVVEANKSWFAKNYTIRNTVYTALVAGNLLLKIPILDETNFTKKTDVKFSVSLGNLSDPEAFIRANEELRKNGLGLEYDYREIDMLVIRDKKN